MKQIKPNTLCFYCLGCVEEEQEEFKPVMRCTNFAPDRANWQEKMNKELRKK